MADVVVNPLSVTENGTYNAGEGKAYNPVSVDVPSEGIISTITTLPSGGEQLEITATDVHGGGMVDTVTTLETGGEYHQITGMEITGTVDIRANGVFNVAQYESANVNVSGGGPTLQAKTNVAPAETNQTIVADTGYDGLSSVQINAIPSTYVGSSIPRRDASDLTTSGRTVTVPDGYYSAQQSKSVEAGSISTPTATKGTVSNHSVTVTPSVSNTSGYVTGGTRTGNAVTISAAELESGNKVIESNGENIDVSGYSTVTVNVHRGSIDRGEGTFTFNGRNCTEFDLFLYNDQSMSKSANYQDIQEEFIGSKWRPYFYGTSAKNKFSFTLKFGLTMPRLDAGEYLTLTEINNVSRWLGGQNEYKILEFDDPYMRVDVNGTMYDVWCRCMLTSLELQLNGDMPYGFVASFICDSPYGYITLASTTTTLESGSTTINFNNISCNNGYYFPRITYSGSSALGTFELINQSDGNRRFNISNIESSVRSVVVDSEKCVITNNAGINLYKNCNFVFPKFINGNNVLSISGATGSTVTIERIFPVDMMN